MTGSVAAAELFNNAGPGNADLLPRDFAPPGTLYDNDVNNGTTSLASQDSTAEFTARSADDFNISALGCPSGVFDVTGIRAQIVQNNAAPQAFGIEIYDDNGAGTGPTPVDAIVPIAAYPEASQTLLGPFGASLIFEASFDTQGLQLSGDTTYWISAFGTDAAQNAVGFNNFFAASNGAPSTTPNGVIIAPDAGVASWTPADSVLGPPALAFSFAIDGSCAVLEPPMAVPTVGATVLGALAGLAGLFGMAAIRRRRRG
jgi:hypothetical protein